MTANRIVDVRPAEPYVLEVTFANGLHARVDVEKHLWGKVFEPLRDPKLFAQGRFDPEGRTIVWPTGADLSPEFLTESALAATS
jgi:hypothetical protein